MKHLLKAMRKKYVTRRFTQGTQGECDFIESEINLRNR